MARRTANQIMNDNVNSILDDLDARRSGISPDALDIVCDRYASAMHDEVVHFIQIPVKVRMTESQQEALRYFNI